MAPGGPLGSVSNVAHVPFQELPSLMPHSPLEFSSTQPAHMGRNPTEIQNPRQHCLIGPHCTVLYCLCDTQNCTSTDIIFTVARGSALHLDRGNRQLDSSPQIMWILLRVWKGTERSTKPLRRRAPPVKPKTSCCPLRPVLSTSCMASFM